MNSASVGRRCLAESPDQIAAQADPSARRQAPGGQARKARDRRGAGRDRPEGGLVERRQPAKTGKSAQFAARWRAGVGGQWRKIAALRLSRTATRQGRSRPPSWSAVASRKGKPSRTAYKPFFRGRRGIGLARCGKTQPRAPCAAVKPFSTQGANRGRLRPSFSGQLSRVVVLERFCTARLRARLSGRRGRRTRRA